MSVFSQQVSVGTSAVRLDLARGWRDAAAGSCLIRNRGSASVYLGNSTVSTSTGFQLDPGESISVDLGSSDPLYAVSGSPGQSCSVLQTAGV